MDSYPENMAELAVEVPKATPQVLLIEDEDLFARAVAKRLTKAGLSCEIAGTLAAAREFLKAQVPALLLLDMRLPDGSGLDFLAEFRASAESADIPVIVMTAYGELEDAVAAGPLAHLEEPVVARQGV